MASNAPINCLPAEILCNIISHLDSPSYVETQLEDVPSEYYDNEGNPTATDRRFDVKNMSLVSRFWREICFTFIFSHLRIKVELPWNVDEAEMAKSNVSPVQALKNTYRSCRKAWSPVRTGATDVVTFLENNQEFLAGKVKTVTVFVAASSALERHVAQLVARAKRHSGGKDDDGPHISEILLAVLLHKVTKAYENRIILKYRSLENTIEAELDKATISDPEPRSKGDSFASIWKVIEVLEPRRLSFMGTGAILHKFLDGSLDCQVPDVAVAFRDLRMVSFSRDTTQRLSSERTLTTNRTKRILTMFKWTSLLLHEGQMTGQEYLWRARRSLSPDFMRDDRSLDFSFVLSADDPTLEIPFISHISLADFQYWEPILYTLQDGAVVRSNKPMVLDNFPVMPKTFRFRALPRDYNHDSFLVDYTARTGVGGYWHQMQWYRMFSDVSRAQTSWGGLRRLASRGGPQVVELPDFTNEPGSECWDTWVQQVESWEGGVVRADGPGRVRLRRVRTEEN